MATMADHLQKILDTAPEITGTPAQIAWAEAIADTITTAVIDVFKGMAQAKGVGAFSPAQKMEALRRGKRLLHHADAGWWIAHRQMDIPYLLVSALSGELR